MNKTILAAGMAFALLFITGFRGVEKTTESIENKGIPKEKKELLNRIAGRWITQTSIHGRESILCK